MKFNTFLLFLSLLVVSYSFSQGRTIQSVEHYKLFDAITDSKNIGVFNGAEYIDEYPEFPLSAEANNKFFGSYNFENGYIIYDEQPYYDLKMKYDLLRDLVILEFTNYKVNFISLSPEFISEFETLGSKFVRLKNNSVLSPYYKNGFFKEAFKGETFSLFTKYEKERIQDLQEKKVYYKFKEYQFYFMVHQNVFYKINSKRDILKVLPNFEKPIKRFFKKSPKLFRKNKELFLASLLRTLEGKDTALKNVDN